MFSSWLELSKVKAAKYEIQKTRNIVSLHVLSRCFAFFTFRDQLLVCFCCGLINICCEKKGMGLVWATKFWLCCSFFIKLTTCHATNLLMLRDKLRVFVSRISLPQGLSASAFSFCWLFYNLQLGDVTGANSQTSPYAFDQSEKRKSVQCIVMAVIAQAAQAEEMREYSYYMYLHFTSEEV